MKWYSEGFTATPDTSKNGLTCPANYEWTDSTHNNCIQVIDGDSKWYTDPICPPGLVYAFSNCYTPSEEAKMEDMYYGISAAIGFVFAFLIAYFVPSLRGILRILIVFISFSLIAVTIYVKMYGNNPAFLTIKIGTVPYNDYLLQFIIICGTIGVAGLTGGAFIGSSF